MSLPYSKRMLTPLTHSKLGHKTLARVQKPSAAIVPTLSQPVDAVHSTVSSRPVTKPVFAAKPAPTRFSGEQPNIGQRMLNWFGSLGRGKFEAELARINKAEAAAKNLKTPQDFQNQTAQFKARLANGESLESLRVEAYAVARQASVHAKGMRPYDCQMMGALAMDGGNIAEMMTGEGKTLTAVMPLYLNALAGKGAHLVTVNDRLAQRDRDDMAPIFETLGLTVGTALETDSAEQKREGYQSDITYTTDRALGFDFLRDRQARRPQDRVQRPLFFALVDEVDQVLLDEARTPLIISGRGEAPTTDYQVFQEIVEDLRPGIEYYVDREQGGAWLTETGTDFVQNELHKETLDKGNAQEMADYYNKRGAIRAEGNARVALRKHRQDKPKLWNRLTDSSWAKKEKHLEEAFQSAVETSDSLGQDYNLFSAENMHRTRTLNASLRANALFEEGIDYLVQDHRVKIVDENKGRTSKGRRFNAGLHQALEAKSNVPIRPESKSLASITYPNLFAKYERLAGMSGTAKSSQGEFEELYDLGVVEVPTNLQFKLNPQDPTAARRHNRIDGTDIVFSTKKEKFEAVVAEAMKSYTEGVPTLVGTLSVEANEYVYARLLEEGVPSGAVQLLNAEHVRGDKTLENSIIKQAGRSGLITVATNMAGRGVNIKPDMVNYKKMAVRIEELVGDQKGSVTVDVESEKEAKGLSAWLEGNYPYRIGEGQPQPGETLIRVKSEKPAVGANLKGKDFPTGGLYVIGAERAKSKRIDDQLIGRAARQGQVGKSQFFVSLEDDLLQYFGGSRLEPTLALLGAENGQIQSDLVEGLVSKVQARVGAADFSTREATSDYDKVLNKQRDTYYAIRDSFLETDSDLRGKLIGDTQEVVLEQLSEKLSGKSSDATAVRRAFAEVSEELGLSLEWKSNNAADAKVWKAVAKAQVNQQLNKALASFDDSGANVDEPYRQSLLNVCDETWSEHLENMTRLKQGVSWVSFAEKDPELEYKLRGFEVFETMLGSIKNESVSRVVPQLMMGAAALDARGEGLVAA